MQLKGEVAGELVLPFICCSWENWVVRAGELALTLTDHSTWRAGPYTSSGQHNRAGPSRGVTGELALRAREKENQSWDGLS